jgi:hypothetical protein
VKEFPQDKGPAPANGSTGLNIRNHLSKMRGLENAAGFGLLLINAIQHQCSLGLPTNVARDRLFLEVWRSGGRDSFTTDLYKLFRPGDIVVNACTKGGGRKPADQLRVLVQDAIRSVLPDETVLRRTHPSSWHFPVKFAHEWTDSGSLGELSTA